MRETWERVTWMIPNNVWHFAKVGKRISIKENIVKSCFFI